GQGQGRRLRPRLPTRCDMSAHPTVMVVDPFQFAFLTIVAGSVGACIGAWYTRRKTLAECEERLAAREAQIAAAFDAGHRLGVNEGRAYERCEAFSTPRRRQ